RRQEVEAAGLNALELRAGRLRLRLFLGRLCRLDGRQLLREHLQLELEVRRIGRRRLCRVEGDLGARYQVGETLIERLHAVLRAPFGDEVANLADPRAVGDQVANRRRVD